MDISIEDPLLLALADALLTQTREAESLALGEDGLPTTNDLSKQLAMKPEKVKSRLKQLRLLGLVNALGVKPKRYQFDCFQLARLSEEHPLFEHFYG